MLKLNRIINEALGLPFWANIKTQEDPQTIAKASLLWDKFVTGCQHCGTTLDRTHNNYVMFTDKRHSGYSHVITGEYILSGNVENDSLIIIFNTIEKDGDKIKGVVRDKTFDNLKTTEEVEQVMDELIKECAADNSMKESVDDYHKMQQDLKERLLKDTEGDKEIEYEVYGDAEGMASKGYTIDDYEEYDWSDSYKGYLSVTHYDGNWEVDMSVTYDNDDLSEFYEYYPSAKDPDRVTAIEKFIKDWDSYYSMDIIIDKEC